MQPVWGRVTAHFQAPRPRRAAPPFPGGAGRLAAPPVVPSRLALGARARRFRSVSAPGPLSPRWREWTHRNSNLGPCADGRFVRP